MINSKKELKEYVASDNTYFRDKSKKARFWMSMVNDPESQISKFTEFLRKEEYYANTNHNKSKLKILLRLYYQRRKNTYGNRLGILMGANCFGKGLTIYHHGTIIVNPNARIGENCKLHGNNCIGNDGQSEGVPEIGDNVDIGFGASIIGDIKIANNIKIGAGAVVTKSFLEENITLVGIPARKLK